jgi:HSP20 family protein
MGPVAWRVKPEESVGHKSFFRWQLRLLIEAWCPGIDARHGICLEGREKAHPFAEGSVGPGWLAAAGKRTPQKGVSHHEERDSLEEEEVRAGERRRWRWGLEVEDQDDSVVVRAEAPGCEEGDFDVRVEDGRLVLSALKKIETKDEKGKMKEYREQECYESVALPAGIDKDKVEAKYHNGLLTVTLPKTAEGKAMKIAVKTS